MYYSMLGYGFIITIFVFMLATIYLGRFIALSSSVSIEDRKTTKVAENAIYGLTALLVALTFAGASVKFDSRRNLIISEVNAVETTYLRLGLLDDDKSEALRHEIRGYLKSRISIYDKLPNLSAVYDEVERSLGLQKKLWGSVANACKSTDKILACQMIIPSINNMFDIANTRVESTQIHPPEIIFILLFILAFISALFAGYNTASKTFLGSMHIVAYAAITAITIYIIIDMEYPRFGFVQVHSFDVVLDDLLKRIS